MIERDSAVITLDDARLRAWSLPMPAPDGDKEDRGHVLVVGGSAEMPGAIILAATAALRAGAGKLVVATLPEIAALVAAAVPEARVIALPVAEEVGLEPASARALELVCQKVDAVLIGPGMQGEARACAFVRALLPMLRRVTVVLDACVMAAAKEDVQDPIDAPRVQDRSIIITPHAGEMAHLTGLSKSEVVEDRVRVARDVARTWNVVVALKGSKTVIATPAGLAFVHEEENVGLAVSGSGDTLAGLVAGLAARGATPEQACAFGVALHARAGRRLSDRYAPLGYLAREISAEVPGILHALTAE